MPLRDHFRPPVDDISSWEELHGQWPAMMVQSLSRKLPPRFVAAPRVHSGSSVEVDVATFEKDEQGAAVGEAANGGVATATWAPSKPTCVIETDMPSLDEYEVRIYDRQRGRRLVGAIEFVSPANKDRPEHRRAFAAKCAALLQNHVSVAIVDVVTTRTSNLYGELLDLMGQADPALDDAPSKLYAVACRAAKNGAWQVETWLDFLQIGQRLPILPLWLSENFSIPIELEESYEESCKVLRIP